GFETDGTTSSTYPIGQFTFPVTKAGSYRVGIAKQPSANPYFVPVNVTSSSPSASVTLQLQNGVLTLVPVSAADTLYPYYGVTRAFNVSYSNGSALQSDVTLI